MALNYPLGQGLRPYILPHLKYIIGEKALPQTKLERMGFINFLQSQDKPELLRLNVNGGGHMSSVQIKYKQRFTEDYALKNEGAVCNSVNNSVYLETQANLTSFNSFAVHIDNELLAQYEVDSTAMMSAGTTPPTSLMKEFMETLMTAANAVLLGLDQDLITTLTPGINRVIGTNTARTINVPLNSTQNDLTSDLNRVLVDCKVNLFGGKPILLLNTGSLLDSYVMQQKFKSANQAGINTAIELAGFTAYDDSKVGTVFGAQNFLAIDPNTVQIVEYMKYKTFKAGWMPGDSMFGTIDLPMQQGEEVKLVEFDYQLRFVSCPTVTTDSYYGTPITLQTGYSIILSKKAGLFQVPQTAYRGTDPNLGVNGVLRYNLTNV